MLKAWISSEVFWTAMTAIGAFVGLYLIYRQVHIAADVASYDFLRKEDNTFRGMLNLRARLAKILLTRPNDFKEIDEYADRVMDYFEDLGYMLRAGIGNPYYMWVTNTHYIINYWHALRPYIEWVRKDTSDPTYFMEFDNLYEKIARIDAKSRHLKRLAVSQEDVRKFLKEELNLTLRPFLSIDLGRLLMIEQSSFPTEEVYDKMHFEKFYQDSPEGFYVAKIAGEIVGYIMFYVKDDRGEIDSIAVEPGSRRLGVGSVLLKYAVARFVGLGLRACYLETRTRNEVALKMFEALGFRTEAWLKDYYADGSDAFRLKLDLSGQDSGSF